MEIERLPRVLQVNLLDARGGAAQVAWNLHRTYRARGLESRLAVSRKLSRDPHVFEIPHEPYRFPLARFLLRSGRNLESLNSRVRGLGRLGGFLRLLAEIPRRMDLCLGREDFTAPGTRHLLETAGGPPDILHLHNLHKDWLGDRRQYFDLRLLPFLSRRLPVFLTLHDAWLLSGHCAHSMECERWRSGCGHCLDLGGYPALRRDGTAFNWMRKREIYRRSRLHVTAPSRWLMNKVADSILSEGIASSRVIPNGVDLSVFHPGAGERDALGLPAGAKVLLFSADGIRQNKLKDFEALRLAIARVAGRQPGILFVALGEAGPTEQVGQAEVRFVPYQGDPGLVACYYRAADIYVHASRADTFPNSVIEALACGTPVVATRVGGIPEQVREGETGYLTPTGDPAAMAEKIELLLGDPDLKRRMQGAAAEDALARFDLDQQVDEYIAWYAEVLQEEKSGPPATMKC